MSGFTGYGGSGGGGGGACAGYAVAGRVERATQAQVDQRVAIGVTCPLFIGPAQNRLKVITVGSGIQLLNQVGAYPNSAGSRAIDWQAWRTAITQVASAYYTTAVGQSNTVDDIKSVAVGYHNTIAVGSTYGVAIGAENSISTGADNVTAIGSTNVVSATRGIAIGTGNGVPGPSTDGIAIGTSCVAGQSAVAMGDTAAGSDEAVAIGHGATALLHGVAIGRTATTSVSEGVAIGYLAAASSTKAVAIGNAATVFAAADSAMALGDSAVNRITKTHNISGPSLIRKDNGELLANAFQFFSGDNFFILTPEVDLLAAAADYDIAVPAGAHFWVEEVGLFVSALAGGVVTQPTVRFGITGTPAKWVAATLCTLLTALYKRERFTLLLTDDGETSMSFGVTVPGAGPATYRARAFFRGMLVEDE